MSCIVVAGMHRTGTSMVAGLLHKAGVPMGRLFRTPDVGNPHGWWEDLVWRGLNKTILNGAGGTWYDVPSERDILHSADEIQDVVHAVVQTYESKYALWGFKDPRSCLTLCALHKWLPAGTKYIITYRAVQDVIASLQRRAAKRGYGESQQYWRDLINTYADRINEFVYGNLVPYMYVSHTLLLLKDEQLLHRLAAFVGLPDNLIITAAEETICTGKR